MEESLWLEFHSRLLRLGSQWDMPSQYSYASQRSETCTASPLHIKPCPCPDFIVLRGVCTRVYICARVCRGWWSMVHVFITLSTLVLGYLDEPGSSDLCSHALPIQSSPQPSQLLTSSLPLGGHLCTTSNFPRLQSSESLIGFR